MLTITVAEKEAISSRENEEAETWERMEEENRRGEVMYILIKFPQKGKKNRVRTQRKEKTKKSFHQANMFSS